MSTFAEGKQGIQWRSIVKNQELISLNRMKITLLDKERLKKAME